MHDKKQVTIFLACGNIRFSSLFAAGDVLPAAKSEEKRMFSQATTDLSASVIKNVLVQFVTERQYSGTLISMKLQGVHKKLMTPGSMIALQLRPPKL